MYLEVLPGFFSMSSLSSLSESLRPPSSSETSKMATSASRIGLRLRLRQRLLEPAECSAEARPRASGRPQASTGRTCAGANRTGCGCRGISRRRCAARGRVAGACTGAMSGGGFDGGFCIDLRNFRSRGALVGCSATAHTQHHDLSQRSHRLQLNTQVQCL